MSHLIRLVHIKTNTWANMVKYPNCHDDLAPFFLQSGTRYTGLDDEKIKELKQFPEFKTEDLLPNSQFWDTFTVRIPKEGITLDKRVGQDLLKYYFLKNHVEVKEGLATNKAGASFALVDEDEEAKKFNSSAQVKIEAITGFNKLTAVEKRDVLRLYNENSDMLSDEVVYERLFKAIESNPQVFVDKWINNQHKDTEVLVSKAYSAGIIKKAKGNYYLGNAETGALLGRDYGELVAYLESPKNQEDRLAILRQLKSSK